MYQRVCVWVYVWVCVCVCVRERERERERERDRDRERSIGERVGHKREKARSHKNKFFGKFIFNSNKQEPFVQNALENLCWF